MRRPRALWWLLIVAILAAGCAASPAAVGPIAGAPEPVAATETPAATAPSPSPTTAPSSTPTIAPTATPSITPTATPSATPSPTPTPENPLMIEVMRRREYTADPLVIETVLEAGDNYSRYIAAYESDGNKIYGLLTIPLGNPPPTGWPVIIFNHGYIPPAEYRTTLRYLDYVDYLARSGYIVFRSDYRGHGSSEGEAGGAYGSPDYTVDVLNGLAAVAARPEADPDRIGMWGHSMGGYITLRSMVVSDRIKAGVIWGGVVGDYPDLFNRAGATATAVAQGVVPVEVTPPAGGTPDGGSPPARGLGRWFRALYDAYGTPEENPTFWASISANAFLRDISGPLQIHHAIGDKTVPVASSTLLQTEMEAAGRPSELYLYEGDNHNISVNFYTAMRRTVEFFDRTVKGE